VLRQTPPRSLARRPSHTLLCGFTCQWSWDRGGATRRNAKSVMLVPAVR